ncbi:MAG: hypothetical protein OXR68_06365 [Alphaproteobacteria bacterium]|nr:hypothetical protein [Alphaproteobacteria bacterium]MDD9920229.1 hypothetical protein [Alphaproteobacteria bacterium]
MTSTFAKECACRLANQGFIPAGTIVYLLPRIQDDPSAIHFKDIRSKGKQATVFLKQPDSYADAVPFRVSSKGQFRLKNIQKKRKAKRKKKRQKLK